MEYFAGYSRALASARLYLVEEPHTPIKVQVIVLADYAILSLFLKVRTIWKLTNLQQYIRELSANEKARA